MKEHDDKHSDEQSSSPMSNVRSQDPWVSLTSLTDARIAIGRAGSSLPTSRVQAFQLAHAQAQDAVHLPLDYVALQNRLQDSFDSFLTQSVIVESQAADRASYLQRPDWGRRLKEHSRDQLKALSDKDGFDLSIVVVDGLSSQAITHNVLPFLEAMLAEIDDAKVSYSLAPLVIAKQGRVALGDDVGACLNARCVLVLIGERPGLSSPDSLGVYLTWQPALGRTDAQRNCISNVRPAGLSYAEAARRAMFLIDSSRRLKLSGVDLKESTDDAVIEHDSGLGNFLV